MAATSPAGWQPGAFFFFGGALCKKIAIPAVGLSGRLKALSAKVYGLGFQSETF